MGERWRKEEREAKAEARAGEVQSQAGREEESKCRGGKARVFVTSWSHTVLVVDDDVVAAAVSVVLDLVQ